MHRSSMMIHRNAQRSRRMMNSCIQQRFVFRSSTDNRSRRASTTTYYDSQSGQHVSIHDESKITAYLRNVDRTVTTTTGAAALSSSAKEMGMAGSVISLPQQLQLQQDGGMVGFMESLGSSSSIFLHILPSQYYDLVVTKEKHHHRNNDTIIPSNINLCFEYNNDNGEHISSNVQSAMTNFDGIQTSIGIFHPKYLLDDDPMLVAAQVANLIDTTFEFGGTISNILVAPIMIMDDNDDTTTLTSYDDELVQLCEELSYLDVPGSTIKSRLVVPSVSGDQLEECLQMGITKYIIDASDDDGTGRESVEGRLNVLRDAVEENGKELILDIV